MSSPLLNATLQATTLSALSNLVAQFLQAYQKRGSFVFDFIQLFRFTLFSLLVTPPNYVWQDFLERSFPTTITPDSLRSVTSLRKEQYEEGKEELSIRNTTIKFILDQSLGASINTLLFIAVMGMFKGQKAHEIFASIYQDFWSMLSAGYKLWPLVCLLNLIVVPFEHRMLVGNGAAFGWGVYMSFCAL